MANTTKYVIPKMDPSGLVKNGPVDVNAALDSIDSKMAGYSEGPFSSRPTSTPGSPGIAGRTYKATDTGQLFIDTGTGWEALTRYGEGTLALRPASGATGRVYRATDTGQLFMDGGTGWLEIGRPATLLAPWRTVAQADAILGTSNTAGFYLPRTDGSPPATANTPSASVVVFPWDPADYAVTGLTTRVRLIVQWGTNNTASGVTWTFYVTFATIGTGTSSGPRWTFGSSVASVAVTTPAANSQGSAATASTPAPSAGPLLFVVQSSGTPPATAMLDAHMHLQVQHV